MSERPVCYCGRNGVLRRSRYGRFWSCPDRSCEGLVGCHPGTSIPTGTMADKATRQARKRAHDAFDRLWRKAPQPKLYRMAAYAWLSDQMGVDDAHISQMTKEEAERIPGLCRNVYWGHLTGYVPEESRP